MKVNKAPCGVTRTIPISKGNINSNDGGDCVKGGILKGTKYAWLCQGSFLKVIDVSSGEKIAGWGFGSACLDYISDVSCVIELPHNDACNLKQIVLGLECEIIGGMICIFDVRGSRLLRAIRIPGKPLSLSIVDSGNSGCEGCYPLPGLLSSMCGIIAVGLQGGSVFLIDLCRLTCDELLNTWFSDDREEVRDEMNPCQLIPINKDDDDSDKLEKKCAAAAVSGDHLCLLLNEGAFVQDNFLLLEPGGEVCACLKAQNIGVTSLLYVPQIASLIVGFSFGCFQLWNLMHLTLSYTSRTMKDPLPVMHLGFQEPSDDPCNFCYLWAIHSSTDEYPSSSLPVGIMYALSYDSKEWVDGYGYLYQDYQSCHFRFEYNLEVDTSGDVDSICCVSFNTLSNVATQRNMPEDGYDEVATDNDFSLCAFAWEVYDSENKPISTYLSLFDLNQWYEAQMPVRVADAEEENLGYLVTFNLNCIRQKGEEASLVELPLLDMKVDPQNISQFKSFQPQEEHFHPSALSLVSYCLLEDKIVSVSHPGLQRYLLLYMEKEGPICLLRPVNLFKHCVMVGLKPILMDINASTEVSMVTQREYLLSVALENQMLGFLHRCASDWANGSVSGVECSLPMLLSWGYQRGNVLYKTAEELCVHLFDHSGVRLDKNECRLLDNCATQLRQLTTLFEGILNDHRLLSLLNLEDFKQKTSELSLTSLYCEVLQWFLNVGLLPEFPENSSDLEASDICNTSVDKIPYPASLLTKLYIDRRLEFKCLNSKNGTKACLYIDQLLQNQDNGSKLTSLWQSDGGTGNYPPPSIQSLLAMYLLDGIDIQTKHSIVIYVFLDLATLLDPERYGQTIEYFVKFPCAFCMTPSIIKITQAFWLLDQKHFEDALDMMLDPLLSLKDLQPWQHRFIVHALLSQGQHNKALEYFTVRQYPIQGIEDIQLKISLLVMNKQVTQAYNFLHEYHNEENSQELLNHFYEECGKVQQLGMVLKLMLSPAEEELFMNFLQNSNISQSEDMQVVYYLMRSRVIEAVAVNERINFSGSRKSRFRRSRNDPTVRDVLVQGYSKTLPSVTRQLANYCSQQKKLLSNWRQVQRPTPMSVDVNYGTKQPVSYKSSLIQATLEKARETWMMPMHSSFGSQARNTEMLEVSAMQNLPFLCTSHDNFRHDRETTPVVFPSVTGSIKRRLDDDSCSQSSTPLKKSRLESSPSVESFLHHDKKKSLLGDSANNSSLLLKSPLVKRITTFKQQNDCSVHMENAKKPFANNFTPQSILKVRNFIRRSNSPEQTEEYADDLLPKEHRRAQQSEEKSCARQIRFSFPVSTDMEEHQPLSSSTPACLVNKTKSPSHMVGVSARIPLRSSLSLLSKPVGEINKDVSSNLTKKSWVLSRSMDGKINEDSFDLNYESSRRRDSDTIDSDDEKNVSSDSIVEEPFYSASSSSNSGAESKNDSSIDTNADEDSPSYNGEKYIHDIKEIKPRRQLSRLKSVSLKNNTVYEESEVSVESSYEKKYSYSEQVAPEKHEILDIKDPKNFNENVMTEKLDNPEQGETENDNNCDVNVDGPINENILGDIFMEDQNNTFGETLNARNEFSKQSAVSFDIQGLKGNASHVTANNSFERSQQIKARSSLSQIRKSRNLNPTLDGSLREMEKSRDIKAEKLQRKGILLDDTNDYIEECMYEERKGKRNNDDNDKKDKIQENEDNEDNGSDFDLPRMTEEYVKNRNNDIVTVDEGKKIECGDVDVSLNIPIVKSFLGDTSIESSFNTLGEITHTHDEFSEESGCSFQQNIQDCNSEASHKAADSSFERTQQIKARRPLSRIRKSGNFNRTLDGSLSKMQKSCDMQPRDLQRKSILLDDTNECFEEILCEETEGKRDNDEKYKLQEYNDCCGGNFSLSKMTEEYVKNRNNDIVTVDEGKEIEYSDVDLSLNIPTVKSFLGDTSIESSFNTSEKTIHKLDEFIEKNDSSFQQDILDLKSEALHKTADSSFERSQQIKARRPLSRVRKSGNFNRTLDGSLSKMEKSPDLQSGNLQKKSTLLDDASDCIEKVLYEETKRKRDDEMNKSHDEVDDYCSSSDVQGTTEEHEMIKNNVLETVGEANKHNSFNVKSGIKKSENLFSTAIESSVICKEGSLETKENVFVSSVSHEIVQETHFEENQSTTFEIVEKSTHGFVIDNEKTYASLSAVTFPQSDCECFLSNQNEVNQNIAVSSYDNNLEKQRNILTSNLVGGKVHPSVLSSMYSEKNVCDSSNAYISSEDICVDEGVIFGSMRNSYNVIPEFTHDRTLECEETVEQISSSTEGESSGTIELDSDESEEKNTPKKEGSCSMKEDIAAENSEIVLIDSDTERDESASSEQSHECVEHEISVCKKSSREEQQHIREITEKASDNSDNDESSPNERDSLVLKLSESESDAEFSNDIGTEDHIKIIEETSDTEICCTGVDIICDKKSEIQKETQHDAMETHFKYEIQNMDIDQNLINKETGHSEKMFETLTKVPLREHSFSNETEDASIPGVGTSQTTDVLVKEHQTEAPSETVLKYSTEMDRSVKQRSSLLIETNASSCKEILFESKNTRIIVEEVSTPRTRQRTRPSSIQSEPPQMSDVSIAENQSLDKIETSQGHGQVKRLRRRRSSLQIEPTLMNNENKFKEETEIVSKEISTSKSGMRVQLSSLQSEPDTTGILMKEFEAKNESANNSLKYSRQVVQTRRMRRTSLNVEPLAIDSDEILTKNKNEIATLTDNQASSQNDTYQNKKGEISTPRTKRRSSSVQSEPPQMFDVLSEDKTPEKNDASSFGSKNKKEGSILTPRTRQRSRPSSVQSEPPQMSDVLSEDKTPEKNDASSFGNKNKKEGSMFTPRTRQRGRSSSVQSEPPQMSDVLSENKTPEQNDESIFESENKKEGSIFTPRTRKRARPSAVQSEPPQISDVLLGNKTAEKNDESSFGNKIKKEGLILTPRTRQRSRPNSVQSEPPQMSDVLSEDKTPEKNDASSFGNKNKKEGSIFTPRTKQRGRSSSVQSEPPQMFDVLSKNKTPEQNDESIFESENKKEGPIVTPRSRQRARRSSVQSEPPQISDVIMENQVSNQNEGTPQGQSSEGGRIRRRRSLLQIEPTQINDKSTPEIQNEISRKISVHKTRSKDFSSPVQNDSSVGSDTSKSVNKPAGNVSEHLKEERRRRSLQSEFVCEIETEIESGKRRIEIGEGSHNTIKESRSHSVHKEPLSIAGTSKESKIVDDVSDDNSKLSLSLKKKTQPSSSFGSHEEGHKMNLRSCKAYSEDRELPNTRGKNVRSLETFSDSDDCSIQSEPPRLKDVSLVVKSFRSRKGRVKKKKSNTLYKLKISPPKLACVKEEPETEVNVSDVYRTKPLDKSENERSPAIGPAKNLRNRKKAGSISSQTSTAGEGLMKGTLDREGSPSSMSSKSTVILDHSNKRKRCSSLSSPDEQEIKRYFKDKDSKSIAKNDSDEPKEKSAKSTNSDDAIEQYATARRLTRYQKNVMERSIEATKGVLHDYRGRHRHSECHTEDSDGESEASSFTSESSHIRSSARLQEKRLMMADRSPSQSSSVSVGGNRTPKKQIMRRHMPVQISPGEHSGSSPTSVHSGKSTSNASSVSNSQWQWRSPNSQYVQSPQKLRRKSFKKAQNLLFTSTSVQQESPKTLDVPSGDTSESDTEEKVPGRKILKKEYGTASEAGSEWSQSSAVSSNLSRNTRSSAKNIEISSPVKSQKKSDHQGDTLQRRDLRHHKETNKIPSISQESPHKESEPKKKASTSKDSDRIQFRESQKTMQESGSLTHSLFRRRKYFKMHSKRKTT